jgi:hypothetical protein
LPVSGSFLFAKVTISEDWVSLETELFYKGVEYMSDGEQKKVSCLNVRTLPHCPSYVLPQPFGPMIKTSVVLSELFVQINVEADIDLCDKAIEIKREKKDIEIKQCELLLNTNTVFISGFVNKNVEYATACCGCGPASLDGGQDQAKEDEYGFGHSICGQIKHCLVKIPFECTAEIAPLNMPFGFPSTTEEYRLGAVKCGKKTPKKEFVSTVFINEKPFGEPVAAYMVDEIIHPHEKPFHKFTEKMVVVVLLKIMQNRQIPLNGGFFPQSAVVMPNQLANSSQTTAPSGIIGELIDILEDTED